MKFDKQFETLINAIIGTHLLVGDCVLVQKRKTINIDLIIHLVRK